MFERWIRYAAIEDLQSPLRANLAAQSDREKRAKVQIAVIDDQPFSAEQNLRNLGFSISAIGDIKDLSEVQAYDIVLCDLQGVGAHFQSKYQGGFLIDEIKRNSPEKFVVAYTGGSLDPNVIAYAQAHADFFLKKDADIDEWRDKLDEIIAIVLDPVEIWKRQRDALVELDIATIQIVKLEDAFVRTIQKRDPAIYSRFAAQSHLNKDLRAVAHSLLASGIFRAVVGS